jgi:hypothetical protein
VLSRVLESYTSIESGNLRVTTTKPSDSSAYSGQQNVFRRSGFSIQLSIFFNVICRKMSKLRLFKKGLIISFHIFLQAQKGQKAPFRAYIRLGGKSQKWALCRKVFCFCRKSGFLSAIIFYYL